MPVVRIRGLPVVAPSVTWTDVKASKELVRSARKICNNGQAVATPADMYVAQREVAFFRIGDGVVPKTQTQPPHVYTDSATTCCILVARTATHGVVTHLDSADCASRNLPGILSHLHQLSNTSTAPEPGPEHAKGSTPMPPVATSELSAVSVAPGGRKMEESEEEDEGDARMDVTATKAAAGAAAETEVYILGSYDDEKGESAALVQAVLRALHEQPVPVVLSEACCLELNTQTADTEGHKRAVITGAGVDTRCGAVVPMIFFGDGLHSIYDWKRGEVSVAPLHIPRHQAAAIAAFAQEILELDDAALLARTSTSPHAEVEDFVPTTRAVLEYACRRGWKDSWPGGSRKCFSLVEDAADEGDTEAGRGGSLKWREVPAER